MKIASILALLLVGGYPVNADSQLSRHIPMRAMITLMLQLDPISMLNILLWAGAFKSRTPPTMSSR
jgi:hypothetical protein